MLWANMSPICLSVERCGGEDTATATQVELGPQEGQNKGPAHLKYLAFTALIKQFVVELSG